MNGNGFLENIYQLDQVNRWSGLYITQPDTVAQHSFRVACIAGLLARIEENMGTQPVDTQTAIWNALFHDIADCRLTHITYEAGHVTSNLHQAVLQAKDAIRKSMLEEQRQEEPLYTWYKQCLIGVDNIRYLIECADVIDAMCFAKREVSRNNWSFIPVLERQTAVFTQLKAKYPCVTDFQKYFLNS